MRTGRGTGEDPHERQQGRIRRRGVGGRGLYSAMVDAVGAHAGERGRRALTPSKSISGELQT